MNIKLFIKNINKNNRGTSIVIFALVLTAITALTALIVDVGAIVLEKSRLSAAVDSAALAGVQELMSNKDNVRNVVENYIAANTGTLKNLEINIDQTARTVEVKGVKTIDYFFARLLGKHNQDISAHAKAKIENISSLKGVRPFAVIQQNFIYGQLYTLKESAGDGLSGNYAAIALGGNGSSNFRYNILYGYSSEIRVNDLIETEPGNMAGATESSINQLMDACNHIPPCTYLSYNRNCPKIIFVPIVNTLDVSGRKYVKVLGFGTFFLEGVSGRGGHADIIGRFITYNAQGEMSSEINDYGTYGIKLVK